MTIDTKDWLTSIENMIDQTRARVVAVETALFDIKREVRAYNDYLKQQEQPAPTGKPDLHIVKPEEGK